MDYDAHDVSNCWYAMDWCYSGDSLQVVEVKVGMHCERCIKAIKKAIKKIEGTYTKLLVENMGL